VQISGRQREKFTKGPIPIENPQNGTLGTVVPEAPATKGTIPTGTVDLPDNPLTYPSRVVALLHHSDKLVPENAPKVHVSFLDLKISGADPSQRDADKGFRSIPFRERVGIH
jgi:hypothetical protein